MLLPDIHVLFLDFIVLLRSMAYVQLATLWMTVKYVKSNSSQNRMYLYIIDVGLNAI